MSKSYVIDLNEYTSCLDDLVSDFYNIEKRGLAMMTGEILIKENGCVKATFVKQVVDQLKGDGYLVALNTWDNWQ